MDPVEPFSNLSKDMIMRENEFSSELDYYAEYCTLSKILVNSGGNDR